MLGSPLAVFGTFGVGRFGHWAESDGTQVASTVNTHTTCTAFIRTLAPPWRSGVLCSTRDCYGEGTRI